MKPPKTKPSLFFRLIVPATVVFILTILALIASVFGDPRAPVSRWLDANGNSLLMWEFAIVVFLSILAMTIDRIRTLRGIEEAPLPLQGSEDTTGIEESTENVDVRNAEGQ